MKIAILSDFHIGYERFREDALIQAEEALESACSMADLILIPGDIFDYRHPKPDVIAEAITLFKRVSAGTFNARVSGYEGGRERFTDVPILAIPGTHERRSDGDVDPVDLLSLAGLLVNANQAKVTIEKNVEGRAEKVFVFGVGGVAEERFKETLMQLDPKPAEGIFSVFIFHQSVYEFLPFSESFIHLEELPNGFDLYIDGHIHSRIEARCHGKDFLIPGSTVLTQLKDVEQEEKGFFVYDTADGTHTFHKIKSRGFFIVKLKIDGMSPQEIETAADREIKPILEKDGNRPIIRVVMEGTLKEGFRSMDIEMREMLERYSKHAIIEIGKTGVKSKDTEESEELRNGMLDHVSIRDYGIAIFMDRLKHNKYDQKVNPTSLFDALSSDERKELVIKEAMDILFNA